MALTRRELWAALDADYDDTSNVLVGVEDEHGAFLGFVDRVEVEHHDDGGTLVVIKVVA